jgi:hypothetical protein
MLKKFSLEEGREILVSVKSDQDKFLKFSIAA